MHTQAAVGFSNLKSEMDASDNCWLLTEPYKAIIWKIVRSIWFKCNFGGVNNFFIPSACLAQCLSILSHLRSEGWFTSHLTLQRYIHFNVCTDEFALNFVQSDWLNFSAQYHENDLICREANWQVIRWFFKPLVHLF